MGLNLVVGVLVDADEEYAEMVRKDFTEIGELLQHAGAGRWAEPAGIEDAEFEMWGYSGLQTVRRLAVHLEASGRLPEPLVEAHQATEDALLTKAYAALPPNPPGPFDHLIYHSDYAEACVKPRDRGMACVGGVALTDSSA